MGGFRGTEVDIQSLSVKYSIVERTPKPISASISSRIEESHGRISGEGESYMPGWERISVIHMCI